MLFGETSNSYTNNKKTETYGPKSVGFKIDIRFVTCINGKYFDVGAVEAAKINPLTVKIIDDEGKLLHEGKDIVDKLLQIVLLKKETPQVIGWTIQLSGLSGRIYTIHLAKPGLYVAIPQSPIQFPSKLSSSSFTETFTFMLSMCQSMNDLALEAQNAISFFSLNQDGISTNLNIRRNINDPKHLPSGIRPTYYMPPNHDCTLSVVPSNSDSNAFLIFLKTILNTNLAKKMKKLLINLK